MAWKEFDPEAMDAAADRASRELRKLPKEHIAAVAEWFNKFYLEAGHKRLGRMLVDYAREAQNGSVQKVRRVVGG